MSLDIGMGNGETFCDILWANSSKANMCHICINENEFC
jgi:hypothetical protein